MVIKSNADLRGLKRANRATMRLLRHLAQMARPGVTTRELDTFAREYIANIGGEPVFAMEKGFPGAINTSVNDVVLHGVPGDTVLKEGDLLSIDAGMSLDGYCGDGCITVAVGVVTPERQQLIDVARGSMQAGLAAAMTGNRIGDIGYAMHSYALTHGCDVMRDFTGHGVGHQMHESPSVPFLGRPGTGRVLEEGLVITIEPVVVEGSPRYRVDPDGWSIRTEDGGWAAQFEHTVMVTRRGAQLLGQL
jgi:methionyl aminopeptidase